MLLLSANFLALESALVLKPITRAFDANARLMSDSVIPPIAE